MGLFLHLRDKVFRVGDQGALPVPLDPDLLFIAENAKQSNIIQQLYRTQMERNRSRGPFGDAKPFNRSKHPFDPKTGEFVETGTGTTAARKHPGHAAKGGEIAESNQYFYKGGQFLPSTDTPPGTYKIKGKILHKGQEFIEPGYFTGGYDSGTKGKWEKAPTPLHRAIWTFIGSVVQPAGQSREYLDVPYSKRAEAKARGAQFDWDKKKWYMEIEGRRGELEFVPESKDTGTGETLTRETTVRPGVKGFLSTESHKIGDLIDRFNRGERWVEVKLPDDVKVLMGKPTSDAFEEGKHPRGEGGQFKSLYHVTPMKNAKSIQKNGLQRFRTSQWVKAGSGERYGGGEIYAFEHPHDALRWAGKMDWDLHQATGTGKIGVVELHPGEHPWEEDQSDPLSHAGSKGRWLKSQMPIPAKNIKSITPVTREHMQMLARMNRGEDAATHDEWKEHEHPRDEDGKFTAGQGKAKVPSAAPEGAPPAKQPEPSPPSQPTPQGSSVTIEEVEKENREVKILRRTLHNRGYEYDHYDEGTNELVFRREAGGIVAIPRHTAGDFDTKWRFKSPVDNLWQTGEMLTELNAHLRLDESRAKEEFPPALEHAKDWFGEREYYLEGYDPYWDTWKFKGTNKDTVEIRVRHGQTVPEWIHRTPTGTFEGEGLESLDRHLQKHAKIAPGQAHTAVVRHYQQNLVQHGFSLDTETPTVSVFKNEDGDLIDIFHSAAEKENPEEVWSRWTLKPEGAAFGDWRSGNSVETLKEMLQSLPEIHQQIQKEHEVRKAHWTEIGQDMVKSLGYNPRRFEVTDEDHEFTLNGIKQFAAGTHWHDGTIQLHARRLRGLTDKSVLGIVAHEVMHEKFQQAMEEWRAERREISEDKRVPKDLPFGREFGPGYVIRPDDTLREEFAPDYPVYARLEPILGYVSNKSATLAKTDGVTDYSRAHWKSYRENKESTLELAINETLAEMAYLEVTDPAALKKVAKPWRDLYKEMVTLYRERDTRRQWKNEHVRERIAWRGGPPETPREPLPNQPTFSAEPHPAAMQLAHALTQILSLGDKAPFKKEEHPQAPKGAPGGHGGEFLPKGEAVAGGEKTETETKPLHLEEPEAKEPDKKKFPQIKPPVTNTPLPKSARGSHPATISSRVPTTKGATDDEYRRADVTAMRQNDDAFSHNTSLFDDPVNYPNFRPGELDCRPARGDANDCADRRVGIIMRHMKKNLRWLYDHAPEEVREQGHCWYEGAHRLAADDAKDYGLPLASVAGVYAALSPQNLWDMNVHQAKTVLDIYHTKQDFKWDEKMEAKAQRIWSEKNKRLLVGIRNKKLSELTDPTAKAMWIRTYDETYNTDRSFNALSPDGKVIGKYKNESGGGNKASAWKSLPPIAHAIICIESGGDRNIISPAMGERHKVRSFYNNILDPDSDNKDVTIDTHAVGAALLRQLGGKDTPVYHSFGKGPSKKEDSERIHYRGTSSKGVSTQGLYAIYADAYRSLAKELGIKPRVLQSITWEAKRRLFARKSETEDQPAKTKDQIANAVEQVWRDYHDGKLSLVEAQDKVLEEAGGFAEGQISEGDDDDTSERPSGEVSKVDRRTGDARELDRSGVRSRPARPADTGGRGHGTGGIAVGTRLLWRNSRLAVFLR